MDVCKWRWGGWGELIKWDLVVLQVGPDCGVCLSSFFSLFSLSFCLFFFSPACNIQQPLNFKNSTIIDIGEACLFLFSTRKRVHGVMTY